MPQILYKIVVDGATDIYTDRLDDEWIYAEIEGDNASHGPLKYNAVGRVVTLRRVGKRDHAAEQDREDQLRSALAQEAEQAKAARQAQQAQAKAECEASLNARLNERLNQAVAHRRGQIQWLISTESRLDAITNRISDINILRHKLHDGGAVVFSCLAPIANRGGAVLLPILDSANIISRSDSSLAQFVEGSVATPPTPTLDFIGHSMNAVSEAEAIAEIMNYQLPLGARIAGDVVALVDCPMDIIQAFASIDAPIGYIPSLTSFSDADLRTLLGRLDQWNPDALERLFGISRSKLQHEIRTLLDARQGVPEAMAIVQKAQQALDEGTLDGLYGLCITMKDWESRSAHAK